jgi:hypothetical protein
MRPPIVSLGLYGDSRTQNGGTLVVFQGKGIQLEGEREGLKNRIWNLEYEDYNDENS